MHASLFHVRMPNGDRGLAPPPAPTLNAALRWSLLREAGPATVVEGDGYAMLSPSHPFRSVHRNRGVCRPTATKVKCCANAGSLDCGGPLFAWTILEQRLSLPRPSYLRPHPARTVATHAGFCLQVNSLLRIGPL